MDDETPQRVEVDLGMLYLGEGEATVADVILGKAADRLLAGLPRDLRHEIETRAKAVAVEELHELLRPVLAAALDEAIQPTNRLGEPRGEPKTLRELVVATAVEALKQTKESSSFGGRRRSLVEQIVYDEVELALARDLKQIVKEEGDRLREVIRAKGGEIVMEMVDRLRAAPGQRPS